ncbi:MAG TPA: ABC transporter ATP-binding protein [Terriglobia bacterium]|nr:ABC transporter ATP-binding protein [Terriglobia bacterium]
MSLIRVDHVSRRFGGITAVDDVSLEIHDREVVTVVGPSGCGKSTLLRIIAGLEQPTSGSVLIDGETMTDVPTRDRNLAMVFQSYALYPHMTCYENLALNLRLKKLPADEIARRVQETARTLEIEDLLKKKPRELSGGQRQRVAVGRALIRKPRAFLFDEPLSNLDALLRERVRHELKELFNNVRATVVYVTHDQIEALTLADRVVVLDKGRIQQVGTPEEVYRSPANRFVASFIGSPSMSLFEASIQNGCFNLDTETIDTGLEFSGLADIGIRPEAVRLEGRIPADITWVENLGLNALVGLRAGNVLLTALAAQRPSGRSIRISFDPKDVHVFEKNSGANVARTARHRSIRP